jgi:nucleotide-binding universal stress UspA family protein
MAAFTRILVPTEFDEGAKRAVALAVEMARAFDASIVLVHAFDPAQSAAATASTQGAVAMVDFRETPVRRALDDALQAVRALWPRSEAILRVGPASEEILRAVVDVRADLVVMATHGRGGVIHALAGSVTEKVVRASHVPVLTVRVA